jgi:hypothetical protein
MEREILKKAAAFFAKENTCVGGALTVIHPAAPT